MVYNSSVEIIPSINVRTFEEVKERIKKVEPYVKWCHLDVTDGIFSKHLTWHDPRDLLSLKTILNVEVHLMVSDPDLVIDDWLSGPVRRVIVHAEALKNFDLLVEKCRDREIEVGVAVNPDSSWELFKPYMGKANMFLFLAVSPGPSGQAMHLDTMEKITSLQKACPGCIIEVDGGVNPNTVKKAVNAGANILVAGNYLFSNPDIKQAIDNLKSNEVQPQ